MINRILAKLEEERNEADVYDDDEYFVGIVRGINIAKEIVQEVAKDGGWIPTADRLPTWDDYAKRFWVTIRCKETGYCTTNKMRWYNLWEYENGKRVSEIFEVIAWKPYEVPAPYQKGE